MLPIEDVTTRLEELARRVAGREPQATELVARLLARRKLSWRSWGKCPYAPEAAYRRVIDYFESALPVHEEGADACHLGAIVIPHTPDETIPRARVADLEAFVQAVQGDRVWLGYVGVPWLAAIKLNRPVLHFEFRAQLTANAAGALLDGALEAAFEGGGSLPDGPAVHVAATPLLD